MKVNIEQAQRAIETYFNQEILSKAVGFKKFTTALAYGMFKDKISKLLIDLANNDLIKMTEVVDNNQLIDIDLLYRGAKEAIQRSGQFEVMRIIFTESDIDKLYSILHTQSV